MSHKQSCAPAAIGRQAPGLPVGASEDCEGKKLRAACKKRPTGQYDPRRGIQAKGISYGFKSARAERDLTLMPTQFIL